MEKPKIQKNIPIKDKKTRKRAVRGDWSFLKDMQRGDSFVVANQRLAQNAYHSGRNRGFSMRIRKISDGYRVWRL